jgi:hypothetical protein
VIENPHLWPPSGDDAGESDAIQTELLLGCDAVLMGRRAYEGFDHRGDRSRGAARCRPRSSRRRTPMP